MFIKQVATRGLVFKIEINKSRNVFNKRVDKQNTIQGVKSICGQGRVKSLRAMIFSALKRILSFLHL